MKIKLLISLVLGLLILTSCSQPQSNSKAFILKGTIDGPNTEYIILSYFDSSSVYVSDTLPVINESFSRKGHLINTQKVSLASNLAGRSVEDPNRLNFYLEPSEIDLTLKEGEFSKAKINGSKTQIENDNLDKTLKPFYEKMELLKTKRQKLINDKKENSNDNFQTEMENLSVEWQRKMGEIKNVQLQYAGNNPQSYLTLDIINLYSRTLPNDSLVKLYACLDPIMKESLYGLRIQEQLNVVNSGDIAPNFSLEDINGSILSLDQFKGKTVLLDFGAAWCVPCVKNHPEIKRIYDKYHSKGMEIIGISFDNDKTIWKENVKKENLNWHHIYEGINNVGNEGSINKSYDVQPIPAYILIDTEGIIIDRYSGADKDNKDLNDLEEKLNALLSSS